MANSNVYELKTLQRLKALDAAHNRKHSIEEYNNVWNVQFDKMSDEQFRNELQYINYLLNDNVEFVS